MCVCVCFEQEIEEEQMDRQERVRMSNELNAITLPFYY